jgi:hypothetical protein
VSGTDFLLFPPLPFSPQRHRNPLPERPDLDLRQTFDPPHHPDSYRVCLVENGALSGGGEQGCKSSDPQLHPSCSAVFQDHPLHHATECTVYRFVPLSLPAFSRSPLNVDSLFSHRSYFPHRFLYVFLTSRFVLLLFKTNKLRSQVILVSRSSSASS